MRVLSAQLIGVEQRNRIYLEGSKNRGLRPHDGGKIQERPSKIVLNVHRFDLTYFDAEGFQLGTMQSVFHFRRQLRIDLVEALRDSILVLPFQELSDCGGIKFASGNSETPGSGFGLKEKIVGY